MADKYLNLAGTKKLYDDLRARIVSGGGGGGGLNIPASTPQDAIDIIAAATELYGETHLDTRLDTIIGETTV